MKVYDFAESFEVESEDELRVQIARRRRGQFGAFVFVVEQEYPTLWLHVNGRFAYLHYFPSDDHPGFQPTNLTPRDCPSNVFFLNTDGTEGGGFLMPREHVLETEKAIDAVWQFRTTNTKPSLIEWFEL